MIAPTHTPYSLAQAPISQADADRKTEMRDAWIAYNGKLQDPLKVKANQPNDNTKSNRCEPIVNKGVSFLFGQLLKIECRDQEFLDALWGHDDERMTLLSKVAINGGAFGQVFLKLIPAQREQGYPRIVNLDPRNLRIVTDPEDCDKHLAYVIEYSGLGDVQKRQIIARVDPNCDLTSLGSDDVLDYWTITNYVRRGSMGVWAQVSQEDWLYPFPPVFTSQNLPQPNEPWGRPDLTSDLIGVNKVLNFVQSNTSRIIKYHAHPKTWAAGLSATQINLGIDDLVCLPSPDSKLNNLEMHSDLSSSLKFAETIRADMDEQSRVPAVALGRLADLPRGNVSGVALQLLFQPLLEKTTQKRRLYGCLIRDISRAALVVAGLLSVEQYANYEVKLHWQDMLPSDDLVAAQRALLLLQIGISKTTLVQQLGYDPEDEASKKAQEQIENPQQIESAEFEQAMRSKA